MAFNWDIKVISSSSKHALLIFVALILPLSSRASCDNSLHAPNNCFESERRALLAIKSDMYDPDDWLSSWTGYDCCKWRGVACHNVTGYVTKLDLHYPYPYDHYSYPYDDLHYPYLYEYDAWEDSIGASKVNPSLLELKHLKYLDLSFNYFSDSHVPHMIASLVHLEYLNLSNAFFKGLIPPVLGNLSHIQQLDLGNCYSYPLLFSYDLSWLSNINSLEYLDMSCVDLSQASNWFHQINLIPTLQVLLLKETYLPYVPSSLPTFNLTSLTVLDLSSYEYCDINASMLRWFSNASKLEHLDLSRSLGMIDVKELSVALGALHNLRKLVLFDNKITGEISTILKNVSRMLQHLDLGWNSLSGEISTIFSILPHQLEFLALDANNIYGRIPEMLGNCTSLRHFGIRYTQVTGNIPRTIGKLIHLEFLDLSGNHITGEIPLNIGNLTNLEVLFLGGNKITGSIPENVGNVISLEALDLSINNITGEIPKTLGSLQNMLKLDLSANSIDGQIPTILGRISNLRYLDVSENHFTGEIPKTFGSLCNLRLLELSSNNINGELADLLDGLSNCPRGAVLSYLNVADNNLSETIPSSLGLLAQLWRLDLSSNSLQGNMTEAHFSQLASLGYLNISFNSLNVVLPHDWLPPFNASEIDLSSCHLGGTFPLWLQSQSFLYSLYLSGVGLSGTIPLWFSNFISKPIRLQNLDLSSNNLSGLIPSTLSPFTDLSNNSIEGPIPASLENANYIRILVLSDNNISGSFPSFLCNLTSILVIDLSNNYLSGTFPRCQSSFPLVYLHLNKNSISGLFPSFLKNCQSLITLDLGENKFSGKIPTWIGHLNSLQILRLSSNSFTGVIPVNIGNLTSLKVLDLSFNKLFGKIPSAVGNFSAMFSDCTNPIKCYENYLPYVRPYNGSIAPMPKDKIQITAKGSTNEYINTLFLVTSIDLSHNNFSGEIPKEMMMLRGLHFLSLSDNHLTGRIPENISTMRELFSLDLSMNNLTGTIPSNLSALNFLSHLNLSFNNLSGRIPTGNQFLSFNDPAIYAGNKDLCGWPLPECPVDGTQQRGPLRARDDDDGNGGKLEMVLDYAFVALGFIVGFWAYWGTMIVKKSIRIALFQMVDRIYDWSYVQLALKIGR